MKLNEWLGNENELGFQIWKNKYQDENESFEGWLDRITNGDTKLRKLIIEKKFLFGGRILANRGLYKKGIKCSYSNCYVLTTGDSIEEIYQTCSDLARTFSYSGGVGIDISPLRPKNSPVNNSARFTTGAVSFMETFSQVTETIGQNGRRGALMLSMSCEHPDIEEFIDIKTDLNKVTKANISVRVTDDFMRAVINSQMFKCEFELPSGEKIEKEVNAKQLFHKLAKNNWDYAEPGILFWDTIENYNLMSEDEDFKYAGVNPCAEEPLPNGGSCLLGSFNLAAYVKDEQFDFDEFEKDIPIVVKAMNDVLDEGLPLHPLEAQRKTVEEYRQIGIGIMGLADMLIKMGIRYDSKKAIDICDEIGYSLANESLKASAMLAKEYGAFPQCKQDKILASQFLMQNADEDTLDLIEQYGLRNSQLLTTAPTGSISTMLGISGGIEPMFNTSYTRKTESLHGEEVYYKVFTPIVKELMDSKGLSEDNELFATAQNIDPFMRVQMQSVWQTHIDASISSTINLPNEATVDLVEQLYIEAWRYGLKGLTIFRDGCARIGVLTNGETKEEPVELPRGQWKSLAEDTYYVKRDLTIGCGKLKLFIGYSPSENAVQDLYIVKTGQGGCEKNLQAIAITMSAVLRIGGSLEQLEKAFSGIAPCPSFVSARAKGIPLSKGNYCGMAIISEVKAFLNGGKVVKKEAPQNTQGMAVCPECGEHSLVNSGGCNTCNSCGYSKCL